MYYYKMKFLLAQMEEYLNDGRAIDATMGGLILGRPHDEGGIYFFVKKGDYYSLEGEVEGFEYILNFGATDFFEESSKRFHQYEKHKGDFEEYIPKPDIKILDTRREIEPKFLLFDDNKFSIINKHSTKGYLQTIDKMNRAITYKIIGENLAERIVNNTDTIEIKFYDESEGFVQISESN
ncbi:hypothetical protein [Flavobacterium sharifuzzamanii]|uniref:hypothetical protein n=1 Tax=Flavobacterium sharifuzzamanii TaxID=2211133 RepID=UPI001300A7E2|nr:hypothetical protein [Flavobacterium sharifuzzamanii]KAF2082084.1 hypothetical protein DMA14_06330 [Flavobacterium sharifuzzamanii]